MSDLRAELEAIKSKHGRLTPRLVLQEARKPSHPLHARFEWSDAVAAERYRLDQARELISAVRVSYISPSGETRSIRAFHALRASDDEFIYEDVETIAGDPFKRKLLVNEMKRDIAEMVARYETLQEFWAELRKLRRKKAS
jgi:hypothetical protein